MAVRAIGIPLAELLLAGGILALGVPAAVNSFEALGLETRLSSALSADRRGDLRLDDLAEIERATPSTAEAHANLAYALLTLADGPLRSDSERRALLDSSVSAFRGYIKRVPGDGGAWAGLASAELARGDLKSAQAALKASILASPWSPSLVTWRCGLGTELFRALDAEGRELMRGQLRLQAERSVAVLVDIAIRRNAVRAARILLAPSPDELMAFETELARRK